MNLDNQKLTPLQAIKAYYLDYCGGRHLEVKKCTAVNHPLWEYRFGLRPETARQNYPEWMDKEKALERARSTDLEDDSAL